MPERILLIEDHPTNLELMSYLLQALGYEPIAARDGAEGVEAAHRDPPDLIICDVQLPVLSGYEVARLLKSDPVLRKIPLVAVTALAMVGDRDKVLTAGFDGYIPKPINPETFVQSLKEFLHLSGPVPAPAPAAAPVEMGDPRAALDIVVLVVDNQSLNIELARSILEPNGWRVIAAKGIDDALRAVRRERCDLILSDVCMNGESGYEFIAAVKSDPRLAAIPFVFITSTMTAEKDRVRGLALGARRFLFRPIEPSQLLAELHACLSEERSAGHGNDSDR
jgi:two-component system cell cycle response regulator